MDAVELEELTVSSPNLLFYVPLPEISGQAIRAILLLIYSDVVWTGELDHELALDLVFVIPPRLSIFEQRQVQFSASGSKRLDIFDLCFDFSEVAHVDFSFDRNQSEVVMVLIWLIVIIAAPPP